MALKVVITGKSLIERIGDGNIFTFYFGEFEVGGSCNNPLRDDNRASAGFFLNDKNKIVFKDFKTLERYDCINFVRKLYNITYAEAVKQIAIDFNIIQGERSNKKAPVIIDFTAKKAKKKKHFTITTGLLKTRHLNYWKQYGINKSDLIINDIKAVIGLKIDDYEVPFDKTDIRFLYKFKDQDGEMYFKIYSPYSKYKWVSSTPLSLPYGVADLSFNKDPLIITKSVKDCILLRKYFTNVIALQNESKEAITKAMLKALKTCYPTIYTWFDTDRAGMCAANYYRKQGVQPIFITNKNNTIWQNLTVAKKHTIKDPSDLWKSFGKKKFEAYINTIKECIK